MISTVRHPVLLGEYELTLDEKNRLLIPAEVRRLIPADQGESLYVVMGINRVPWLYCERYYEDLVMQRPADMIPAHETHKFNQLIFGTAAKLAWDKAGRILLPERTVRRAELAKDVVMVGVKDHLELYRPQAWDERLAELEKDAERVFDQARIARQGPPAVPVVQGSQPQSLQQ